MKKRLRNIRLKTKYKKIDLSKPTQMLLSENANAVVEYIIVLPIVLLVLCTIFVVSFVLHDRTTLDEAAQRGVIYGAHLAADPNYDELLASVGNESGSLDLSSESTDFTFTGFGTNIQPYRAFNLTGGNIPNKVERETVKIIEKDRIGWQPLTNTKIKMDNKNYVVYQTITVEASTEYPLPKMFTLLGLPESYKLSSKAIGTVNDTDDFLRNADLALDVVLVVDEKLTGGNLNDLLTGIGDKITSFTEKISGFLESGED